MPRPYKPHAPEDLGALVDKLHWMGYAAPTFEDPSFDVLYSGRDLGVVFWELNEGLGIARNELGETHYRRAVELSDRMRALFEADFSGETGQAREGKKLIQELLILVGKRTRN